MTNEPEKLLKISKLLTREYLTKQLTKWFNREIELTDYKFGEGTGKGDSYLSDVYRVIFHGKIVSPHKDENPDVSVNTILKALPANIGCRKTFRSIGFFENEIKFYRHVLPALLEFQAEKNIENPFDSYPKVFAAVTDGSNDFLALEDLSYYDFTSATRQEGIDYNHFIKILDCFAKFHALSFAFKDQRPKEFTELSTVISEMYYDEKYWDWYINFWKRLCVCAVDAVEKEYPDSIYLDKVREFATEKTFFRAVKAAKYCGKSAVFSHGDSWTPNFLVKYKSGAQIPEEVKMIDFQLARCASPVLDIAFFIYACSTEELRKEHYHSLLTHYHDALSIQIKALGSDPNTLYPWTLFMEEVKQFSFFGLAFSCESTPVIILDPEDAFEMDTIEGEEAVDIADIWTVKPIKKKSGRLRIANNFVHAVDNNYI